MSLPTLWKEKQAPKEVVINTWNWLKSDMYTFIPVIKLKSYWLSKAEYIRSFPFRHQILDKLVSSMSRYEANSKSPGCQAYSMATNEKSF